MSRKTIHIGFLQRILLLLCLVILPLIFRMDTIDPVRSLRTFILGLLAFGGLLLAWSDRKKLIASVPIPLQIAWWAFLLVGVLGIPLAHNAWESTIDSARLMLFTGLLYFFCHAFKSDSALVFGHRCLVVLSVILGVIGGLQVLGWGMLFLPGSQGPPYATFWASNFLSSGLLFLLPINLTAAFRFNGIWRILAIAGGILVLWMVIEIKSSASLLGLGMMMVMVAYFVGVVILENRYQAKNLPLLFRPRWRKVLLLITFMVIGFTAYQVLGPATKDVPASNLNSTSESEIERLVLWKHSADMLTEHPLLGVGPGNWKFHILEKGISSQFQGYATRYFVRTHNDFLQAFAERGLFGGLAFLSFILGAFFYGLRQFDRENDPASKLLLGMATSGLLGWAVIAFFSFPTERPFHLMILLFFVAVVGKFIPRPQISLQRPGLLYFPILTLVLISIFPTYLTMGAEVQSKALIDAKYRQNWPEVVRISATADQWPWEFERHTFAPYTWYAGNAYLNLGQYPDAKQALTRAAELHPWHPQVLSNYGAALVANGELAKGADILEALLVRYPDFHDARTNLTEIYLALNQRTDVLRTISYWEKLGKKHSFSVYSESVRQRLEGN